MRAVLFSLVFIAGASDAIGQADSLQQQINEQVWKPFIKSFNSNDDKAFSEVHSEELTRVEQDANRIIGFAEYFKQLPDSIQKKQQAWKKNIELRFIQRIASNGRAFEVGYYKTSMENTVTGKKHVGYGKFHVLLRKENGVWKILMDADANDKTNEEIFLKGKPL